MGHAIITLLKEVAGTGFIGPQHLLGCKELGSQGHSIHEVARLYDSSPRGPKQGKRETNRQI